MSSRALISIKNAFSKLLFTLNILSGAVHLLPSESVVEAGAHYSSNSEGFKAYHLQEALN